VKWKKLGQIFSPEKNHPWMMSHAANPVAEQVENDRYRIYFNCRDAQNRSHIGSLDLDIGSRKILSIAGKPILAPGSAGSFDDSGVSIACIVGVHASKFLYYVGWNLGVTVPWRNSIGLAVYNPAVDTFEKFSPAPIIDRNAVDPFSVSYPFVLEDGPIFRMWYGSNLGWGTRQEDMAHVIKYAESANGIDWERRGEIALNFKDAEEYALSRPFVLKENGIYKMWYSFRGAAYKIGYAESSDAVHWERKDELAGITSSESSWDGDMIEYPFLFRYANSTYMLYNGNDYGKTGFGLAILEA